MINGFPNVFPKSRIVGRPFWRERRFSWGNRHDKRVPLRFSPSGSGLGGFGKIATGKSVIAMVGVGFAQPNLREQTWRQRPERRSSSCNPLFMHGVEWRGDSSIHRMAPRDDSPIESVRPRRPRLFFCSQNQHVVLGEPRAEPESVPEGEPVDSGSLLSRPQIDEPGAAVLGPWLIDATRFRS